MSSKIFIFIAISTLLTLTQIFAMDNILIAQKSTAQQLLYAALREGDVQRTKKALAMGANIHDDHKPLELALHSALNLKNATEVINVMLEAKADPNKMSYYNQLTWDQPKHDCSPLNLLIVSGNEKSLMLIKLLLNARAAIEYGYDGSLPTPFHLLAQIGYRNIDRAPLDKICRDIKPAIITLLCDELNERAQGRLNIFLGPQMMASSIIAQGFKLDTLCNMPHELWQANIIVHLSDKDLEIFSQLSKQTLIIAAYQRAQLAKKKYALNILDCRDKEGRNAIQKAQYWLNLPNKDDGNDEMISLCAFIIDVLTQLKAKYDTIPGHIACKKTYLSSAKSFESPKFSPKEKTLQEVQAKLQTKMKKISNSSPKNCAVL